MGDDVLRPIGSAVTDAMIARAEASCERTRVELTKLEGTKHRVLGTRRTQLRIMEKTLSRLKADQDGDGSPRQQDPAG